MKRIGNLYQQISSLENLFLADQRARKGKKDTYGIRIHDRSRQANLFSLHHRLRAKTYQTSAYRTFTIHEPKERLVFALPYFPDRITHHAVLNILEPIFRAHFTADTYSCVKGRGIHGAVRNLKKALLDHTGTRYCLKIDIRKFYPSIDHDVLKGLLRRKFKDGELLWLLDEIIDSAPGIPIGNYLSQYFGNFYLSGFDHWVKEDRRLPYYFRYMDDMVFLAPDKEQLHALLADIREYLSTNLRLELKGNYQVFPVAARGIDFVGYRFFHTHILLRKSIKQRFARMIARRPRLSSFASYYGWACHCNSLHLLKKLSTAMYKETIPTGSGRTKELVFRAQVATHVAPKIAKTITKNGIRHYVDSNGKLHNADTYDRVFGKRDPSAVMLGAKHKVQRIFRGGR